jgi:membrane protease YdiL (CAAX protease family)
VNTADPPAKPSASAPTGTTLSPLRESLLLWVVAVAGLVLAKLVLDPLLGPLVANVPGLAGLFSPKTVAAGLFLYLPLWAMRRRNEYPEDYGARTDGWQRSVRLFLVVSLITLPLYAAGCYFYAKLSHQLPWEIARSLTPYQPRTDIAFRLPRRFPLHVVDQLLVVALPEEFFYRGYFQQRLESQLGEGRPMFGIRVGRGFLLTQVLFALGHLVEPYPWRLAVFFPALLFGWLRKRSDTLLAGVLYHATCNLAVLILEASVLGLQ